MMARVSHALNREAVKVPAMIAGVAAGGTALLVTAQYGLNHDFDTPSPPSTDTIGWSLGAGALGSAVGGSMMAWGGGRSPQAGRGLLIASAGVTGAILIGAPVVRRFAAEH